MHQRVIALLFSIREWKGVGSFSVMTAGLAVAQGLQERLTSSYLTNQKQWSFFLVVVVFLSKAAELLRALFRNV